MAFTRRAPSPLCIARAACGAFETRTQQKQALRGSEVLAFTTSEVKHRLLQRASVGKNNSHGGLGNAALMALTFAVASLGRLPAGEAIDTRHRRRHCTPKDP